MRYPFSMDHLDDQKKSRQILLRLFVVYFSLGVLIVGITHVQHKLAGPQSEPVDMAKASLTHSPLAARPPEHFACAEAVFGSDATAIVASSNACFMVHLIA